MKFAWKAPLNLFILVLLRSVLSEENGAEKCLSRFQYEYDFLQKLYKLEERQQKLEEQNNVFQDMKQKCKGRDCPDGWMQHKDSCYYFSPDKKSWTDAKWACLVLGGNLAEINDSSEDSFLVAVARLVNNSFWIGLTDLATEGTFVWAGSGTKLDKESYSNWYPGQPTNCCGGEDCVHIFSTYGFMWNDAPCDGLSNFVCEK